MIYVDLLILSALLIIVWRVRRMERQIEDLSSKGGQMGSEMERLKNDSRMMKLGAHRIIFTPPDPGDYD